MSAGEWVVRPDGPGRDLVVFGGVAVGVLLWVRELRYPAVCRIRMAAGLNGVRGSRGARLSWTAVRWSRWDDSVWVLLHNGVEVGELRWRDVTDRPTDRPTDGVLAGLNMLAGRRPVACEPLPVARPLLRVVR